MKLNVPSTKTGAIGDIVYSRNRQGTAGRTRIIPVNPQTVHQQSTRAYLASITSSWRGLKPAERASWASLASQLPGRLSGFNAFTMVNMTNLACGGGQVDYKVAPALPSFTAPYISDLTATHAKDAPHDFSLTLQIDCVNPPDMWLIDATAPYSQGVSYVGSTFRRLSLVPGVHNPGPTTFTDDYIARFGDPADNTALAFRITPVTTGFRGIPFTRATIVSRLT